MLLLCIAALFMTGSRGGVLISLLLLIVTFTIYFRKELSGKNLIVVVTSVSLIALALLGIVGGSVSSRIDLYGLWDTARIAAWRSTFEIIRNNVWFGTGLGTFPWVFPAYRSSSVSMWGVWDAAHSTPLELAAELGLPLAIIVSLAWIAALLILARGLRGRRELSLTPLTSLSGSLIALLHSTFDFSLQVAGFSIVIFALLGIGLSQAVQRKGRRFGKLGDIGLPPLVAQSQQGSVRPRSTGAYVRRKGTRSYLNRHDRSLSHLRIKQQQD
nr:O-antigen ligase family protein [Bradyrhizobium diazoefficiens]